MNARQKLIDATRGLLSRQGYEATSPREIQIESGVGQGSFYHHFDSKLDLASQALGELGADMSAEFDELPGTGLDRVDAYLDLEREALAGCRIGRLTMESSIVERPLQQPVGEYFAHLRESLTQSLEGLDLPVPPDALADLAIAAVQGGFVLSRATGDADAQQHATTALRGLLHHVAS